MISKFQISLLFILLQVAGQFAFAEASADHQDSIVLGRLFSTPAQRTYLDALRKQMKATGTEITEDSALTLTLTQHPVTFNGSISRSNQSTELWINGEPQSKKDLVNGFNPYNGAVLIKSPNSRHGVSLKPGQTLDTNSGKIVEPYQSLPPATLTIDNTSAVSP